MLMIAADRLWIKALHTTIDNFQQQLRTIYGSIGLQFLFGGLCREKWQLTHFLAHFFGLILLVGRPTKRELAKVIRSRYFVRTLVGLRGLFRARGLTPLLAELKSVGSILRRMPARQPLASGPRVTKR